MKRMIKIAEGALIDPKVVGNVHPSSTTRILFKSPANQVLGSEDHPDLQHVDSRLVSLLSQIQDDMLEPPICLPKTNDIVIPSMIGLVKNGPLTKGGWATFVHDRTLSHNLVTIIRAVDENEANQILAGVRDLITTAIKARQ